MLKRLKSVSMLLFLMGASTGAAYAVANPGVADVKITQQNGACTGVVVDATGETVIGASVVVKGTTNGTITGIDGDFSLSGVKQGDVIQVSFVGYLTQEIKFKGESLKSKACVNEALSFTFFLFKLLGPTLILIISLLLST